MADAVIEEGNGLPAVHVQKGDRIFVSLARANMDVSRMSVRVMFVC